MYSSRSATPDGFEGFPTESAADRDEYIVYAKLPKPEKGHHGCIVVPADHFVTGIHYHAYGPASQAECDAFVAKNCKAFDAFGDTLRGGEIPRPLLK